MNEHPTECHFKHGIPIHPKRYYRRSGGASQPWKVFLVFVLCGLTDHHLSGKIGDIALQAVARRIDELVLID
jgi:hypothetical protein